MAGYSTDFGGPEQSRWRVSPYGGQIIELSGLNSPSDRLRPPSDVDGRGTRRYNARLAFVEQKAMPRIARSNNPNPADGRLPSSDAKLKLNRLLRLQRIHPLTRERQAALVEEARAARKAERERKRAALARRH
jgi:hypothetical protein